MGLVVGFWDPKAREGERAVWMDALGWTGGKAAPPPTQQRPNIAIERKELRFASSVDGMVWCGD